MADELDGDVLFQVDNASCYEITDGTKRELDTGALKIVRVANAATPTGATGDGDDPDGDGVPDLVFLKCGETDDEGFTCPLAGSEVPSLRIAHGAYVFPLPGDRFYGVQFHPETPQPFLSLFEDVLDTHTNFHVALGSDGTEGTATSTGDDEVEAIEAVDEDGEGAGADGDGSDDDGDDDGDDGSGSDSGSADGNKAPRSARALNKTSAGIAKGSKMASAGMIKGARFLGGKARAGGRLMKTKIKTKENATEVSDKTRSRLAAASKATSGAVKVSGILVQGVAAMACAIGEATAEQLGKTSYGQKFQEGTSGPRMAAARGLGVATLTAIDEMLEGLTTAGKILAVESATATVEVVEHRYGEEAGAATADGLRTVGNVAEVGLNAKKMGKKAILGAVVKETGKGMLTGETSQVETPSEIRRAVQIGKIVSATSGGGDGE